MKTTNEIDRLCVIYSSNWSRLVLSRTLRSVDRAVQHPLFPPVYFRRTPVNMAAAPQQEPLEEELTCTVCLEVFTDPVILSCRHSFCRACVEEVWKEPDSGIYACPQCRTGSTVRPALEKNFQLANIVERYMALEISKDAVPCSYCTKKKRSAVKSCLRCQVSMCSTHHELHSNAMLKSHPLTDPTADTAMEKCTVHQKPLEIYCKDDSVCVCTFCALLGNHKGHEVIRISEAVSELRNNLEEQQEKLRVSADTSQATLKDLQKEKQDALEFNSVAKRFKDVSLPFIPTAYTSGEMQIMDPKPCPDEGPEEVKDREMMIKLYGQTPTLDPDTANPYLVLTDNNRTVSASSQIQLLQRSAQRFDRWPQVLGTECVSCGRSYWEVEIREGGGAWSVGVCYTSINRNGEGNNCLLGFNNKSWCIHSGPYVLSSLHNGKRIAEFPGKPSTVGVFVDFEDGVISFYSVLGSKITLLYTFHGTFSEPLCPALRLRTGVTLSLSALK
ncbi:E3 ubiquitin-protein ligase TRIM11-like isoform X2 [Hemitrygon akajei]|uniref:E3 ubiquitin-protein ligase TRIM11-like isoform X2 n=1 Tax=Hemitrygon akajei TaxID=2704970 RepID=UPI003BFA0283